MNQFFSCDWGTTSFRLRRVNAADGTVLDERREASGAKALSSGALANDAVARAEAFASFLRAQLILMAGNDLASWDGVPVLVSGMASSSIGWRELPYAPLPVRLDGFGLRCEEFDLELAANVRARIRLITGVCSGRDVMRGEETEICGLFADGRHADIARHGLVVLPGTHSKHVRVRDGEITGFDTYMTGELFDVLSAHSILRTSVQASKEAALSEPEALEAFLAGMLASAETGLARGLFQTRTRSLLRSVRPEMNWWFLSGLLIGSELSDLQSGAAEAPILLAATEPQSSAYALALETLGLKKRFSQVPPEEMALASVRGHRLLLRGSSSSKPAA